MVMSHQLQINLFGSLTVLHNGQPLPDAAWHSRQERRLLAILLTMRGSVVTTERLIDWLWPAAEHAAAAITLRSAVSSLRRTLEPYAARRAPSSYVLTRHGGYTWNDASSAQIDVDRFSACLQQAAAHEQTSDDQRLHALEQAVALYRGDYLEDELDARWALSLRERLRDQYLRALCDLGELLIARGSFSAAIDLAHQGLDRDPLREPLYRMLMRAQALAGDAAAALQSYERYRQALDDLLGAEPSLQTRELHSAILRGIDRPRPTLARLQAAQRHPTGAPLVGRERELEHLRALVGALDDGRGGVVAITGEAGIGKTRLADQARAMAIARGALAITLRATALERSLPFAPLSEALRPLLRASPEPVLRRLPVAALAQAADLLPVLRERLPDLPALPPAPPAERHNRLLDGLVDLALALSRERPLCIVADDAQWADEATLAAVGRLARRTPRYPLLIVLAYRLEEVGDNPALHMLLRTLGRELLLQPLYLARFNESEIARFLAGMARLSPRSVERLAARLLAPTGGNPLFLTVALQSLLETHPAPSLTALLADLDTAGALPDLAGAPQVRDLVLGRLERLPEQARDLLEHLALIARPASLDLIEQLAGPNALETTELLLERQFLGEGTDGRLSFSHDLVCSTIAATLSSPQRRRIHRRLAEALAALYADRPERAAELAFHFAAAGHGAESALLTYATTAGDHARRGFGYHQALDHYTTAITAAGRLGTAAPPDMLRRAFMGRLLTYEALLDWEGITATAAAYDRWRAHFQPVQPPLVTPRRLVLLRALMGDLMGAAAISAAQIHGRAPDDTTTPHQAIADMLERTATILQPVAPTRTAHWVPFVAAPPVPGAPADELPRLLGSEDAALALFQIGWAALMQGHLDDAEPCLLRSYDLAVDTGQAAVAVVASLQVAHLHALRGASIATERWLLLSLDLADQAPEAAWASIWPRIHQGFLWLLDDHYDAAYERFATMAAQLADLPAFQSHRVSLDVGLGLVALARREAGQAALLLHQALASPQLLYGFVYVAAQLGLARLAALSNELQEARAILTHALNYSARRSLLPEYARTAIEIARIERDFGNPAPTLALLDTATNLAAAAGLNALAAAARALLARLSAAGAAVPHTG